jgi:hypothetical protein
VRRAYTSVGGRTVLAELLPYALPSRLHQPPMEDADSLDTEALLAILSSLLDPPIPELHVLLDALACADGEVEAAAKSLQLKHASNAPRTIQKRVATGVLDDWLTSPAAENDQPRKKGRVNVTSTLPKKSLQVASQNFVAGPSQMPRSSKLVPLMDVLRPPPSTSPTVPRLAPLMLPNPSMVEQYTPCTLHLGVLPTELACRLFHRMVDASKGAYFCDSPKSLFNVRFLQNGSRKSGGCLTDSWKVLIRHIFMLDKLTEWMIIILGKKKLNTGVYYIHFLISTWVDGNCQV